MVFSQLAKAIIHKIKPSHKKHTGDYKRRHKYRVSIINLGSLATVFSIKARMYTLVAMAIGIFLLIGVIWTAAYLYTPMGYLLPMKLSSAVRDEYASLAMRIDSVSRVADANDRYYRNLYTIIYDSLPPVPTDRSLPQDIPLDSLMMASDAERRFVEKFEASERYNLSVLSPLAASGMSFFSPLPRQPHDFTFTDQPIPQITLNAPDNTPVSAVYRGTVLNTYFTSTSGATVVIQHPNNFVSVYSGLSHLYIRRGDKVSAGQRIGTIGSSTYPMSFELWHDGTPLNPTDYIEL